MEDIAVAINLRTGNVACVLLQALYGGSANLVSQLFPAEFWDVNPDPDHKMVMGSYEQWQSHLERLKRGNYVDPRTRHTP